MNDLLDSEDSAYKDFAGPFVDLPSSLLEDLLQAGLYLFHLESCLETLLIPANSSGSVH